MKFGRVETISLGVLALFVSCALVYMEFNGGLMLRHGRADSPRERTDTPLGGSVKITDAPPRAEGRAKCDPGFGSNADRKSNLEILKSKWAAVSLKNAKLDSAELDARDALVEESIRLLLFSPELLDLVGFLRDNEIVAGRRGIEGRLPAIAMSSSSPELRLSALETARSFSSGKETADSRFVEGLISMAGAHCSEAEFSTYFFELRGINPALAQEALFEWSSQQMKNGPEAAFASVEFTLEQLRKGVVSGSRETIVDSLGNAIPPGSDFPKLVRMFEKFAATTDGVRVPYDSLIYSWTLANPVEAAKHVMEDPGKYGVQRMRKIGELGYLKLAENDEAGAFEWLKSLPSGTARDYALAGAAHGLSIESTVKAREVASLIGDSSVRHEILEEIRVQEQATEEEEGF